ncbi:MAG: hypothetical protein WBB26_01320 [Saprospiraceae bacterium]
MKNFGKEDSVDKIFRQKLKDHDSSGTEYLWKGIESRLNQESGKRTAWYFGNIKLIAVLSLFVLGGYACYSLYFKSGVKNDNNKTQIEKQIKSIEVKEVNNNSVATMTENSGIQNTNLNPIKSSTKENLVKNKAGVVNLNSDRKKFSTGLVSKKELNNNFIESRKDNDISAQIDQSNTVLVPNNFAQNIVNQEINNEEVALNNSNIILNESTIDKNKFQAIVNLEKLDKLSSSVISKSNLKRLKKHAYDDDGCNIFKNDRKRFYLDIYYAPELTSKKIEARDPLYDSYAKLRRSDEKFAMSYSMGARASVVFRNGVAFRSGFAYSAIKENFDWVTGFVTTTNVKFNPITGKNDTIVDPFVPTIERSKNFYKFYDIPVYIGYEKELKDFVFSVNAGLGFNIAARQSGVIYENEKKNYYKLGSNTDAVANIYRQNVGVSALFNFGLNYRLNQRWRLLVEPSFRYYMSGLTTKSHVLEHTSLQSGLMLGLRYKLM